MKSKMCTRCNRAFPASNKYFYENRHTNGRWYLRGDCKQCHMKDVADYSAKEDTKPKRKQWIKNTYANNYAAIKESRKQRYEKRRLEA